MAKLIGPIKWDGDEDEYGYRTYTLVQLVEVEKTEGPQFALDCDGVPSKGDVWDASADQNDWAWCISKAAKQVQTERQLPNVQFHVTSVFSSKPAADSKQRCNDQKVEDPLLEPPRISVSTSNDKEEATHDRFGQPITNSAWEQLRGPQIEFDKSSLRVKIVQNVPNHLLPILSAMRDTVNGVPLWGCPVRTIKLASVGLERKFYGQCEVYWERTLEFEIRAETWDRYILDEGTKALNGHWNAVGNYVIDDIDGEPPDRFNPAHFIRFKDRDNENCRVVLNGRGVPAKIVVPIPVNEQGIQLPGFVYNVGNVVSHNNDLEELYIAITRNSNIEPVDLGPLFSNTWVRLTLTTEGFPANEGILTELPGWSNAVDYARGDLIRYVFINLPQFTLVAYYVALKASGPTLTVPRDPTDPDNALFWKDVSTPSHLGPWLGASGNNPYTPVDDDGEPTSAGEVFVSKYGESNFAILGLPAIF